MNRHEGVPGILDSTLALIDLLINPGNVIGCESRLMFENYRILMLAN
jgi:hypothetical protein